MEETPLVPRIRTIAHTLTALLAATLAQLAPASPTSAPPPPTTTWRASATVAQLTPAHIEQLARDKLLIGPQTHRQIFQPYIAAGMEKTRFITSDAALAAYHALFEDSFRELELRRADELRRHLEALLNAVPKDSPRFSEERTLIQHILGPALVTLGAPLTEFDEKLRGEIERQATLIRTAEAIELPEWLGPPSADLDSLDYRRCKPVSFYAGQPALENYFRALRWLQLIPLRANRDAELSTWALLAYRLSELGDQFPEVTNYFSSLSLFVGPQADRGLTVTDDYLRWYARDLALGQDSRANTLRALRQYLLKANFDTSLTSINDERREKPSTARDHDARRLANIRFRIAPTFALPDAELISQSLDAKIRPNGLMIAALLGSSFAEERMPKVPAVDWITWKKSARILTLSQNGAPRSLYADYFDTLRALNTPPVENAPAFMRSAVWQAKTVQTQLASWAQARHTYTLQAKLSVTYFGAMANTRRPPPGFVEPNPAFWREYTRLVERTATLLEKHGVFSASPLVSAARLRETAESLEKQGLHLPTATRSSLIKVSDEFSTWKISVLISQLGNKTLFATNRYASDEAMRADVRQAIDFLNESAAKIESGQLPAIDPDPIITSEIPLTDRWQALTTLARQLETIVVKQLDETELSDADRYVLIHFGQHLAHTMGYFSSAYHQARDDAPRWAEVAHISDLDQSLGIGISRAKSLHILYPWQSEELLCIGAVLPYFEEWAPTKRLTDEEWKQKLDSPSAPRPPAWIEPLLAR